MEDPAYKVHTLESIDALREVFPDAWADEMNFCLFSTLGTHGTYDTIEDVERGEATHITVLVIKPRICAMWRGHIPVRPVHVPFLKRLRATSWAAVMGIGRGDTF